MTPIYKILIVNICILFVFSGNALGQDVKFNESVVVLGGYEPTLSDAFKINQNPTLFDTVYKPVTFEYNIASKRFATSFIPELIRPAKIMGEPITRLYRNYAKLGIGTYLSPLAEFYYSSSRSKNTLFGVYLNHFSSWQSIKETGNSSFSNTGLNVFGKRFWPQSVLAGEVFYTNNFYHYYGFNETKALQVLTINELESSKYSQSYNRVGIRGAYQSLYTDDKKLHHSVNVELSDLMDKYESNELNFKLHLDANKKFELFNKQKQTLGFAINWDMDRAKVSPSNYPMKINHQYIPDTIDNQSILTLYPYIQFAFYKFNFDAGINASLALYDETKFYVHPHLKASQTFLNNQLTAYAGISGKLKKNSLQTLRIENPFISAGLITRDYTNNAINVFGGLRANPAKGFDVQAEAMYSRLNNTAMYGISLFSYKIQNVYDVIYDDVDLLKLTAQASYLYEEKFNLGAGANYYSASPANEKEYWYQPSFDMNMFFKYTIASKIMVGLTAKFVGEMKGYYYELEGQEMASGNILQVPIQKEGIIDPRIDISLSLEYRYSKSLSFFWLLNNITSQRYYEWMHYPSQKFNTMIGLTYAFR